METTSPGSGRTIEKALFMHASPERVFRALTDPAELEKWFVSKAVVDLRPGGVLKFTWREHQVAEGVYTGPTKSQIYGAHHRLRP